MNNEGWGKPFIKNDWVCFDLLSIVDGLHMEFTSMTSWKANIPVLFQHLNNDDPIHWIIQNSLTTRFYILTDIHPGKLTCPLKRDYFNRKYIFQPLIFRGHVSFQGSTHRYIHRNRAHLHPSRNKNLHRFSKNQRCASNSGCKSLSSSRCKNFQLSTWMFFEARQLQGWILFKISHRSHGVGMTW